jgi:hypothetical protein
MADRLPEELEAAARQHRERLALYPAKDYSSDDTSAARMRKLQQESDYADQRLQRERPSAGDHRE